MNAPTNITAEPVYLKQTEMPSDRILHYVIRWKINDGCFLYLIKDELLFGYDNEPPFDLVWTTRLKDATRYRKEDAQEIANELTSNNYMWWTKPKREEIDEYDKEYIESCEQYIRRTKNESRGIKEEAPH